MPMRFSELPFDLLESMAQVIRNLPPNPVFHSEVPRLPIVAFASTNRRIREASLPALVRHIRIKGPCHLANDIAINLLEHKTALLVFIRSFSVLITTVRQTTVVPTFRRLFLVIERSPLLHTIKINIPSTAQSAFRSALNGVEPLPQITDLVIQSYLDPTMLVDLCPSLRSITVGNCEHDDIEYTAGRTTRQLKTKVYPEIRHLTFVAAGVVLNVPFRLPNLETLEIAGSSPSDACVSAISNFHRLWHLLVPDLPFIDCKYANLSRSMERKVPGTAERRREVELRLFADARGCCPSLRKMTFGHLTHYRWSDGEVYVRQGL